MDLLILYADNPKKMNELSEELSEKKFKTIQSDDNFILMRKRRFGNPLIHAISLVLALFVFSLCIAINVVYFSYSYLWASPTVLITTETVDEDGNKIEFNDMDEVMNKAFAML